MPTRIMATETAITATLRAAESARLLNEILEHYRAGRITIGEVCAQGDVAATDILVAAEEMRVAIHEFCGGPVRGGIGWQVTRS